MCIFTNEGRAVTKIEILYIRDVHQLIMNNCLFHNNNAQLQLIVIKSVLNVEIFGCEFYQNKGQKDLIKISYLYFLKWITVRFMTMT